MGEKRYAQLRAYVSKEQQDLIDQGYHILSYIEHKEAMVFDDYSFVVFPFAKAYEGFLKQFFLDAGYITQKEYVSDHFRVGKVLSPNLVRILGKKSVYKRICDEVGQELADTIWETWKTGRNQVFHYFPHNIKSLTLDEARETSYTIVATMEKALENIRVVKIKKRLSNISE